MREIKPEDLIDRVAHEAIEAAHLPGAHWRWQDDDPASQQVGYGRAIFVIPLPVDTFDDPFNGSLRLSCAVLPVGG